MTQRTWKIWIKVTGIHITGQSVKGRLEKRNSSKYTNWHGNGKPYKKENGSIDLAVLNHGVIVIH